MLENLKKEFKVVGPLYAIEALLGISEIHGPLFIIYFLAIGFSPSQLGLIFIALTISSMVFEIPTGAIADHFGRRISVAISLFAAGILMILVAFTYSFTALLIIFAFFGITNVMANAATNAWMVDSLKHGKGEKFTHKCLSRKRSFFVLFTIPAFLLSSFLLFYGGSEDLAFVAIMKWLWIVSGAASILAGFVAVFAKEAYFRKKKLRFVDSFKQTWKLSKEGAKYVLKHPLLIKLMIGSGLFYYALVVVDLVWQPYFKDILTLDPVYFGVIMAGGAVLSFIALNVSPKFIKRVKNERSVIILITSVWCLALLLFAASSSLILILLAFYLFMTMRELIDPFLIHWFNQHVPSKTRATTMSVWNMMSWFFITFAAYFGYGLFTEWFGMKVVMYLASVIILVGILIYSRIKKE